METEDRDENNEAETVAVGFEVKMNSTIMAVLAVIVEGARLKRHFAICEECRSRQDQESLILIAVAEFFEARIRNGDNALDAAAESYRAFKDRMIEAASRHAFSSMADRKRQH